MSSNSKLITYNSELATTLPVVAEWAAAWTKARAEKALVEYLEGLRVASFLPLVTKRRVYGRHVRISDLPLFPGYVFFDRAGATHRQVLESKKVAKIIYTDDAPRLKAELANIAIAVSGKPLLHNVPFDVKGTPVRVFKGPFKDLHGQFVRRRGKNVIVVKITLLSRAVEMEIDEAFVERT